MATRYAADDDLPRQVRVDLRSARPFDTVRRADRAVTCPWAEPELDTGFAALDFRLT